VVGANASSSFRSTAFARKNHNHHTMRVFKESLFGDCRENGAGLYPYPTHERNRNTALLSLQLCRPRTCAVARRLAVAFQRTRRSCLLSAVGEILRHEPAVLEGHSEICTLTPVQITRVLPRARTCVITAFESEAEQTSALSALIDRVGSI